MSRHRRLQKSMRSPARAAKRAGKRPIAGRARAYQDHRLPLSALLDLVKPWQRQS